jgi:hypothetical protein
LSICFHLRAIDGTRRCRSSAMPRSTQNGSSSGSARGLARSWPGAAGRRVAPRRAERTQRLLALLAEAQLQLGVAGVQRRVRERRLARGSSKATTAARAARIEVLASRRGSRGGRRRTAPLAAQLERPDAHALQVAAAWRLFDSTSETERPLGDRAVEGGDEFVVRRHRRFSAMARRRDGRAAKLAAMFFGISDYASFVVAVIVFLMIPGPATSPSSPPPARAASAAAWRRRSASSSATRS